MKKSFLKRFIAGMLAGTMIMTSLSGCGTGNDVADAEVETETDENGDPVGEPRDAADRMAAYENPEEVYDNPLTVEGHDEYTDLSVSVTADESVMNGAESVYIEHVYDSVDAWQEMVNGIEDDAVSREVLGVFDISLLNGDRDRIEPDDSVVVSFSGPMIAEAIKDKRKLELYHLPNKEMDGTASADTDASVVIGEEDDTTEDVETISGNEMEDPEADGQDTEQEDSLTAMMDSMEEDGMSMSAFTISELTFPSDDGELVSDEESLGDEEDTDTEDEETDADGTDGEDGTDTDADSVSSNSVEKGIVNEDALQTLSDIPAEEAEDAVERVYPQLADESTIIFDATGFSEYALVLREDSKTQVETQLYGDDEYFEADKYLTMNGYDINGQPSATINIEQAYYTSQKKTLMKAPARHDIVMAIDATGSMGGMAHKTNEFVLYYLYNVMTTNQDTLRAAAHGDYEDYKPFEGMADDAGNLLMTFDELKAKTDDEAFNKFKEEHLTYVDGICTFNYQTYTTKENTPLEIITWDDVKQLLDVKCKEGHGCGEEHYIENGDGTVTPNIMVIANPVCGKPINGWNDWSAGTHVTGKSMRYYADDAGGQAGCHYTGSCHVENRWNRVFDPNWAQDPESKPHVLRTYTRTDLAAKKCKEWMGEIRELHPGNTELSMVLCTDGMPCEPFEGEAVDHGTSNNALQTAKEMKEQYDARIYTAYIPTTVNKKFKVNAYRDIKGMGDSAFKLYAKNPDNGFAYVNIQGNPDVDTSDILFMTLFSSDFKHGGVINKKSATINTVNDDITIKLTNDKEYTPCSCSCPDCINFRSKWDRCTGELIKDDERPNDPNAMMCSIHGHQYRFVSGMDPNGEFSDNLAPNGNCQVWIKTDPGTCPTNCPTCVDGLCGGDCTESRQKNNVEFEYPAGGEGYFDSLVNGILLKPYTISDAAGNTEDYNIFGNHMYTMDNASENNIKIASEIADRMEQYIFARTNKFDWGYAHNESYIKDVITDPFEVTDKNAIKVYAIPRTPKHIDADGIPQHENADGTLVSLDKTKGCNSESELQLLDDADFYWPEQTESADGDEDGVPIDMWKDVTGSVLIDAAALENNTVIVSGYNYEQYNACSNYDIDFCRSPEMAGDNGLAYRVGDYGYKLLVQIPINSHRSFGGNSIKTNNTDESGFYPSTPGWTEGVEGVRKRPVWTENEEKNPNKNEYVLLYPECKMNLRLNYDIVKDDAVIYAPEMKSVHDLVTDASNNLFAIDPQYAVTKRELKNLKAERETIYAKMAEEGGEAGENYGTYLTDLANKNREIEEKEAFFNLLNSYVPNGSKNMFVDIDYSLISPSGATIATMHIPHGTAYTVDQKTGEPNIDWTITGGKEVTVSVKAAGVASDDGTYKTFRALTENGNYTISCNITPVETVKSPTWHCDDNEYPLTAYTPTGSSGIDAEPVNVQGDIGPSKAPLNITENPTVYIFVMEINVDDTKQESGMRVDVNQGVPVVPDVSLVGMATQYLGMDVNVLRDPGTGLYDTSADKSTHINSFRWVCVDGTTKSDAGNEPGLIVSDTGKLTVDPSGVSDPVVITTILGEEAGLVKLTDGLMYVNAQDGQYVPIKTVVARDYKPCNKGWENIEKIYSAPVDLNAGKTNGQPLNDTDNLYDGSSSVSFDHVCYLSESCNQADGEMADAIKKYGSDVRYLIHVFKNVAPDVHKTTTDGNSIFPTGVFKWTITASNKDISKNANRVISNYSLIDILPHADDGRHTAMWDHGTQLHGTMKYNSIVMDLSKAPSAKKMLQNGTSKMYYTFDSDIYKYPGSLSADDVVEGFDWHETGCSINGDTATFSGFYPNFVYAFKFDTQLAFGEELTVYIEADTENPVSKQPGDVAINSAFVYIGDGFIESENIPIEVSSLSIDGRVWIDEDFDKLISANEKGVPNISLGLYRKKNNTAEEPATTLRSYRLSDGTTLELVAAYNTNFDRVPSTDTDDMGNYSFTDLQPGTYYIVADGLPDGYEIVDKCIAGSRNASTDDSEAEVYYLDNGSNVYRDNSALIKEVVLGASKAETDQHIKGMNIGIQLMNGEITVGKAVKILKIPNTLPDEDRKVYKGAVTFYFHHVETGTDYTKELFLNEQNYMTYRGEPQVWGTVEGLPLGTYIVSETPFKENNDVNVHTNDSNVFLVGSAEANAQHIGRDQAVVKLTPSDPNAKLWFENELMDHTTGSYNHANMHIPVKLEIKYKGPNPVGDQSMLTYTFKREDFEDMIVTYDDGTTISLKEGTLPFGNVVLTPGSSSNPITRKMNTGTTGKPITVIGYYSERGHLVKDSFKVRVTLKDLYKFKVYFGPNSIPTEGGTGFVNGGFDNNMVSFIYDDVTGEVEVTAGIYKDVANNKLSAPHHMYPNSNRALNGTFRQSGWNTSKKGEGGTFNFDTTNHAEGVLSEIGRRIVLCKESGEKIDGVMYADGLLLHAQWKGVVTFNANGTYDAYAPSAGNGYAPNTIANYGYLIKGEDPITGEVGSAVMSDTEPSYKIGTIAAIDSDNRATQVTVEYTKNATIFGAFGLEGEVNNTAQDARFELWNDSPYNRPNSSYWDTTYGNIYYGDLLNNTRTFQGGEQFYAVYYTTEFKYIGRGDAFIAPRDGTYTFKLWGSPGGNNYYAYETKHEINNVLHKGDPTGDGGRGGLGGFVKCSIYLRKNAKIYVYVGSAGSADLDAKYKVSPGGYNGGGLSVKCMAAGSGGDNHGSSGGGATHISLSDNPIISDVIYRITQKKDTDMQRADTTHPYWYYDRLTTVGSDGKEKTDVSEEHVKDLLVKKGLIRSDVTVHRMQTINKTGGRGSSDYYLCYTHRWDNINDVIAVAGGGGGGGRNSGSGLMGSNVNGQLWSYGGGDTAGITPISKNIGTLTNLAAKPAADNVKGTGYTHGAGRFAMSAAGGGGGWWGGYANSEAVDQIYGNCLQAGNGGTSYINTSINRANCRVLSTPAPLNIGGNDERLTPGTGIYEKPDSNDISINGYITVE